MDTAVGDRSRELTEERPPDWSPVEGAKHKWAKSAVARVVSRSAVALAIGVVLWLLGRHVAAVVLVAVLFLLTAASLLFPSVAAGVDRGEETVRRVAGRALAFVLLGVVHLLVFTPLSALLRLAGHDPLALRSRDDASTFWRPSPRKSGRPLYRRPFAYERLETARPGGGRRLRAALAFAAIVLLIDVGVGALLHARDKTGDAPPEAERQSLLLNPNVAAARNEPWLNRLAQEIDRVWYGKRYDPFLGWTMPSFAGTYLHTKGGIRRSYQAPGNGAQAAVNVFFFGGSTMFGLFQRDEHTIPSEVARLAGADGIDVHVFNYGQMAYNNWQEVLLLEQLASRGRAPDLAVFYDGANELVGQFRLGPHGDPSHQEEGEFAQRIGLVGESPAASEGNDDGSPLNDLSRSYRNVSGATWLWNRLRGRPTEKRPPTQPLVSPWAGDQKQEAVAAGADASSVYARGVDVARRLGDGYGFRTAFFWQPFLYSKKLVPGEEPALGALGTDPEAWTRANAFARSRLARPVVDLGDALDAVSTPIMYDFVHTNEIGAKAVARALYLRLRAKLRELSARGQG